MSELAMTRALSFRHSIASLFIAGFIATIVFHQAVFSVWYLMGTVPNPPFNFARTAPFGVPAIWALAFFGGLWGIAYGWVENKFPDRAMYWIPALIFGPLAPTLGGRPHVGPPQGHPI